MELNNKIYQGDAVDLIKQMPDKCVDLIVTDPPYGYKFKSNMGNVLNFGMIMNDDTDIRFKAYDEFPRIMKDNTACIVFCSWKNYSADYEYLSKILNIMNVLIWYKGGSGIGDLKHTLSTDYEMAIICHKGKCLIRGGREGSVWKINKIVPLKMQHPTQKPVELFERIIKKFSDNGNLVFDPFLGSGTTAVASIKTDRKYLGFELDKRYFDVSQKRIADTLDNGIQQNIFDNIEEDGEQTKLF